MSSTDRPNTTLLSVETRPHSEATLIPESITKPQYTNEALDYGLEGLFKIDVFVNANGEVEDVEIDDEIGFGMDSVLIEVASKAQFIPRRDKNGKNISGWAILVFDLVIE